MSTLIAHLTVDTVYIGRAYRCQDYIYLFYDPWVATFVELVLISHTSSVAMLYLLPAFTFDFFLGLGCTTLLPLRLGLFGPYVYHSHVTVYTHVQ